MPTLPKSLALLFAAFLYLVLPPITHAQYPLPADSSRLDNSESYIHTRAKNALLISLFNTVIPAGISGIMLSGNGTLTGDKVLLMGYGALLGPSMGYFYIGMIGRGLGGWALRTTGALVAASGTFGGIYLAWNGNTDAGNRLFGITFPLGLFLVASSAIIDIAKVRKRALKYLSSRKSSNISLMPITLGHQHKPGLQLTFTF